MPVGVRRTGRPPASAGSGSRGEGAEVKREPDELQASGLAVIDRAMLYSSTMAPLFSGGHDSFCACHIASKHPKFRGEVYHIDTGIGAKATRAFVDQVCRDQGWRLRVYRSPSTYERFVRERGFPGPGMHGRAYTRLKDRCVRMIVKGAAARHNMRRALITGCRSQESTRRMGHVEPVKIGERSKATGELKEQNRCWVAPCHDWSAEDQHRYMDWHDLPRNPLKLALGMSGECFCGAFAEPGERAKIDRHCPEVGVEIDRLAVIARECGMHDRWGTRPDKGIVVAETGPLCTSCDRRATFAGIIVESA
jgi:3'-phosphoadenosine 5'-phosphosulfate sulfotransferase (PAPS reductase)/FAD synthetase